VWIDHRSYFHNIAIHHIIRHYVQKCLDFEFECLSGYLHTSDIFLECDSNTKSYERPYLGIRKPLVSFTFFVLIFWLNSLVNGFTQ